MKTYAKSAPERSKSVKGYSGFWNWVIFSPEAFNIAFRIGIISPPFIFGLGLLVAISLGLTAIAVIDSVFLALTIYAIYRNRWLLSHKVDRNIAGFVWGMEVK